MAPAGPDSDQDRTVIAAAGGDATLHSGSRILNDTYVINRLLGKGGMGEVYEAEHIELSAKRAIKIILPEFATDTQYVGLFIEEARKLSRVNNDAIVRYYEFSRDEAGARYLVMEFVAGESLSAILEHRRLEPPEILSLLERLAQGLAAVYECGIKAHRDISPANIILPQGRVDQAKVIDFGIAKSGEPDGVTLIGSDFAGKYSYMSPEQVGLFGGPQVVNEKSDIYSLGLLLAAAAMGYGQRLDMGSEPASVIRARQTVPNLSAISAELQPLLSRMLQPLPQDRPESMRALIEEARRPTQHEGGSGAMAAIVDPVPQRSARRLRSWPLAGGIAGLALIAAAAAVVFWPGGRVAPSPPAAEVQQTEPLRPPVATVPPDTASPDQQVLAVPPPEPLGPPVAAGPLAPAAPDRQVVAVPPQSPPPARTQSPDPRAELNDALKGMDCASLHAASPAGGGGVIKGTVPNALDQAKLLAIAARLPADTRPEISVAIVPPPVCRPLSDFGKLQAAGIVEAGGIEIGLAHGVTTLHEGDPIAIEVTSRHDFPVNLRIDYFTLGGEVLHMWPNADLPTAKLAAGATSEFLKRGPGNKVWQIGGAPFGTELITAIATAAPLDLSAARPAVEPAGDYLRDLKSALSQVPSSAGEANLAATLLIHTSEK